VKIDLVELKRLVDLGHREYVVLLDYLRYIEGKIENIKKIEEDIEKKYPNDQDLYVELANYYIKNDEIYNAIKCLEKYKENKGENIEVLILLSKKYIDVKDFEKAKKLLEKLIIKNNRKDEIKDLLYNLEKNLKKTDIKEMNEDCNCNIEDKITMLFKDGYDINVVIKEIKDMLLIDNCDRKVLFDKISYFIQKLNLDDKYEETKLFFNEIYNHIPNEYIKLKNILLNEYELANKQITLKSYPRKIRLELTHKCNVSCIMCKVKNDYYDISDKEIKDLLEIMPYIQELTIQGGEIFLDLRLNSILDSIIKYQPSKITVITNGLLLNEFWLEKLSKTNIELTFSIDSQKKDIYEKIRIGGKFETLIDRLKMAAKFLKNKRMILNMVVMRCNYKEIEDMIRFASAYGFSEIHLNPVDGDICKEENFFEYKVDNAIINEIRNKSDCYEKLAKQCGIGLLNRLPIKENTEICSKTNIKNNEMFCYNPFRQMFLSARCYAPNCECIGIIDNVDVLNENDNLILQKWNSFVMREYRKAMIEHKENIVCRDICKNHLFSRRNIMN